MAIYFAVYNRQAAGEATNEEEWEGGKLEGRPEMAKIIKVSAGSVAAAQALIEHFFGGDVSSQTVIVTEAAYKES